MNTHTIGNFGYLAAASAALGVGMPSLPKRRNYRRGGCERERQRHEWRARVDAAAREWQRETGGSGFNHRRSAHWLRLSRGFRARGTDARIEELDRFYEALDAALAAPKPWRKR